MNKMMKRGKVAVINIDKNSTLNGLGDSQPVTRPCDTLMYQNSKVFLWYLRVLGCFYLTDSVNTKKRAWTFGKVYCLIVAVLVTVNAVRFVTIFNNTEQLGQLFFICIMFLIWNMQTNANTLLHLFGSPALCKWFCFFESYRKELCEIDELRFIHLGKTIRRIAIGSTIALVIYVIYVVLMTSLPWSIEIIYIWLTPASKDSLPPATAYILYLVFSAFNFIYNIPIMYAWLTIYICICIVIIKEFSFLNSELYKSVSRRGEFQGDIENFRLRHSDICGLVEAADEFFSWYICNVYASTLPMICLAIYNAVYTAGDGDDYTGMALSTLANSVIVIAVSTVFGVLVNENAHSCAVTLQKVSIEKFNIGETQKLQLFLSRVTGPPIGFSVGGLFVIDKSAILTVLGTILTYAVVMVQFKPSASAVTTTDAPVINSTNTVSSI